MQRLFLIALLALFACQKDPDTTPQKMATYLLLCQSGISACYTSCGNNTDTNRNGAIDASEYYAFTQCTNVCATNCDITFLYTALSQ